MKCEWAFVKNAGGGVAPITGCVGYPAEHVHHGPDKNTFKNVEGNVHRICTPCHNRWHGANDPYYGERPAFELPFLPTGEAWTEHAPIAATDEEIFAEERRRRDDARKHGRDPNGTRVA